LSRRVPRGVWTTPGFVFEARARAGALADLNVGEQAIDGADEFVRDLLLVDPAGAGADDRLEVGGEALVEPFSFLMEGGEADVEELVDEHPVGVESCKLSDEDRG